MNAEHLLWTDYAVYHISELNWIAPYSKVMQDPIPITYKVTTDNVTEGSNILSFQMSLTVDKLNTKN